MSDESPSDRFKTILAGASRAIAHDPEVEVTWTADAPSAAGNSFRIPMPGRSLPRAANGRNSMGVTSRNSFRSSPRKAG